MPQTKVNLTLNYKLNKFDVFFRNVYFGSVDEATNEELNNQEFAGKVVTDLSLGYAISERLKFTLGANNLLDVYPDKNIEANRSSGRFIYSRRSQQFGSNGRYMFGRVQFTL
ncbi:TonB-dependent receptor [Neolewinella antarctica]|uniref:Outer membrane receptor protein involved in Fe transport n=1 Tax=Neolewinella antarctica TaxID=442734 RepID=A0ABX0XE85_9BACT|nr:TonB-dependent receptor [Neolewinella antarctica]NJC27208.1 outer membrane receptor protein involved in Fe transport [Neolewinella antarctica]